MEEVKRQKKMADSWIVWWEELKRGGVGQSVRQMVREKTEASRIMKTRENFQEGKFL